MARKAKPTLNEVKFKVKIQTLANNQIVLHTGEDLDEVVTFEGGSFPNDDAFDSLKFIIRSILDKKAQQEIPTVSLPLYLKVSVVCKARCTTTSLRVYNTTTRSR